jgi:hypothetical protein
VVSYISKDDGTISYDGAADYPISLSYTEYRQYVEDKLGNDISYMTAAGDETTSQNSLKKIVNLITSIEDKIEEYTTATDIEQKTIFIETKKNVDKLAGLDLTTSVSGQTNDLTTATDIVVQTEEGQLGYVMDDTDISEALDNLIAFGLDMEEEGRNFIFFHTPTKYADSIPYTDYSDKYDKEVADTFSEYRLDRYDCGEALTELGMTECDIFYNTDHHWKPSTGILADKLLCEYLNDNYGYDIDTSNFELDQYTAETYEGIFLGSLGRKTSRVYADTDDFVIYYPKYDTDLTVYLSFDDTTRSGTVQETLFDYTQLEGNSLYDMNAYEFYGYHNQALLKVHNNLVNDGSHILLLKTSFANCMIPYLAAAVEDLEAIDLRYFSGSIRSYIEETDPDLVIVQSAITHMETDSAESGTFDFR